MGCGCSKTDGTKDRNGPEGNYAQNANGKPPRRSKVRGADGVEREESETGTNWTALNTEEASEIARLSRAESVSKLTNEPSTIMITIRRKFIITRAMLQHGINEDVNQFDNEIQESISEMREKDRRRVREWLESVQRALKGRRPSEFPPINQKVDRNARRTTGRGGQSPGAKPLGSKMATPQQSNLEDLTPSAAIEAEFGGGADSSNHANIRRTGSTNDMNDRGSSSHQYSRSGVDGASHHSSTSGTSASQQQNRRDNLSTGAAYNTLAPVSSNPDFQLPISNMSPANGNAQNDDDLGSPNFGGPSSSVGDGFAGSPGMHQPSASSGGDSVKANADGDNVGLHLKPTAERLGH